MSDGYKVSIELELEDKFTTVLTKAIDELEKANEAIGKFSPALEELSTTGEELADKLEEAADSAKEIFKAEGLAETVRLFDSLAKSSDAFAKSMEAALAASAKIGAQHPLPKNDSQSPTPAPAAAPEVPKEKIPAAKPKEGEKSSSEGSAIEMLMAGAGKFAPVASVAIKAAKVVMDVAKEGIQTNLDMEDSNKRVVTNLNVPPEQSATAIRSLRSSENNMSDEVRVAIDGKFATLAEERYQRSKVVGELSVDDFIQQSPIYEHAAAVLHATNDEEFIGAAKNYNEIAERAGITGIDQVKAFVGDLLNASLTAKVTSEELNDTFKSLPNLVEKNKENLADNIMAGAVFQKQGLTDGKNAETLNKLAAIKWPQVLGNETKKDKETLEAMNRLGLYNGTQATFFRNGSADMALLASTLAKAKQNLSEDVFGASVKKGFGDGELAESLSEMYLNATKGAINAIARMNPAMLDRNAEKGLESFETGNESNSRFWTNLSQGKASLTQGLTGWFSGATKRAADGVQNDLPVMEKYPSRYLASIFVGSTMGPAIGRLLLPDMAPKGVQEKSGKIGSQAAQAATSLKSASVDSPLDVRNANLSTAIASGNVAKLPANDGQAHALKTEIKQAVMDGGREQFEKSLSSFADRIKPTVKTSVYLDSKEITSHLISDFALGTAGINPYGGLLAPQGSSIGIKP
jgi:hypothetical protein